MPGARTTPAPRLAPWRPRAYAGQRGEHALVDLEVLRDRSLPSEVACHRLAHHLLPARRIRELLHGAHGRVHEVVGRVVIEDEARDAILDRVTQPADAACHGNGAVALCAHL